MPRYIDADALIAFIKANGYVYANTLESFVVDIDLELYKNMYMEAARGKCEVDARAEALERALREFAPCETCVGAPNCKIYGQALACTLFGFKPDAWQFDQARFAEGGE